MLRRLIFVLIALVLLATAIPAFTVQAQDFTATTRANVKFREGTNVKCVLIATIPRGTVLPALGRSKDNRWVQVSFEGRNGWVAAANLRLSGKIAALPVVDGTCVIPTPQVANPALATLVLVNKLGQQLDFDLEGPETRTINVRPLETVTVQLKPGTYRVLRHADGYEPDSFEWTLRPGRTFTFTTYTGP